MSINNPQQLRISSSSSSKSHHLNSAASSSLLTKKEEQELAASLPIEIICLIMSFLNLNDRKNASLISKRWRNAFEDGYMLKDIVVKGNNNLLQQKIAVEESRSLYEKAINIEFKNDVKLDLFQDEKTQIDLTHLKCLILNNCTNLNSKILFNLLKSASSNIEKLYLIQCDTLFMNAFLTSQNNLKTLRLEHVRELSLSKNRYLNDQVFSQFLDMMPNLKKLDLSYCFLTKTQFTSLKTSDSSSPAAVTHLSSAMLTFENVCMLIGQHGDKIKSLNLTGVDLLNKEENILKLLVNIEHLQLDELIMENLTTLKIRAACKILNKQNRIKSLSLNNSMQSQDDYTGSASSASNGYELLFTEIFDNKNGAHLLCDSLTELRLKKLYLNANCYILCDISKLQNLCYLDLSYCSFNSSFTNKKQLNLYIKQLANNLNTLKQLETLILSYCEFFVNDYLIQKIALSLNKLKYLDIRNCSNITNKSLHFISKFLTNLEYLDVSWCRRLTDHGLNKNLIEILLKYETSFDKHTSFGFCKCSMCIKMLTNGIHVNQQANNSDDSNEDFCEKELDEIIIENETCLKNLKKLKTLKLESCNNLSDIGLVDGLCVSQLNELDIKLCTNITGMFLANTGESNLNLKTLNLNQCINFTSDNLLHLLKYTRNLKQLFTSACPAMNNRVIEFLRMNKIILNALDVSYCTNVNEHYMDLYEQFLYNEYCSKDFFIDKRFISKQVD